MEFSVWASKISKIFGLKNQHTEIFFWYLVLTKRMALASKNWAFSVFRVNFEAKNNLKSSWKWFSCMNLKLGEQLLLIKFSILVMASGRSWVQSPVEEPPFSCLLWALCILAILTRLDKSTWDNLTLLKCWALSHCDNTTAFWVRNWTTQLTIINVTCMIYICIFTTEVHWIRPDFLKCFQPSVDLKYNWNFSQHSPKQIVFYDLF